MIEIVIALSIILILSLIINIILFLYLRRVVVRIFVASEQVSEIFSFIDSYSEHLRSVYELPTFYGDDTLKSLLDHTNEMVEYLKKYEDVYSFTQPDLEEQLASAVADLEEEYDDDEAP